MSLHSNGQVTKPGVFCNCQPLSWRVSGMLTMDAGSSAVGKELTHSIIIIIYYYFETMSISAGRVGQKVPRIHQSLPPSPHFWGCRWLLPCLPSTLWQLRSSYMHSRPLPMEPSPQPWISSCKHSDGSFPSRPRPEILGCDCVTNTDLKSCCTESEDWDEPVFLPVL